MTRERKPKPVDHIYYNVIEAAQYLGIKRSTLDHYRCDGRGPKYRKHGWRVFYARGELDRWSDRRQYQSTTKKDPI